MPTIGEALRASAIPINLSPADIDRMSTDNAEHKVMERKAEFERRVKASGIPREYRSLGHNDVMPRLRTWSESFGPECLDAPGAMSRNVQRPRQSLLFLGETGRGKTRQACAIAMTAIRSTPLVRFVNAAAFVREIGDAMTCRVPRGSVIARYSKARLLVFDDLGKDATHDWGAKAIWDLLSDRGDLPTIITTQYDEAGLHRHFANASDAETADAIVSRVFCMYPVLFDGPDMRRKGGVR